MGLRATLFALAVSLAATPVAAQDRAGTLAEIRQELTLLWNEVQALSQQLSTTGGTIGGEQVPASTLDRVNRIESELQRLTARTEELQFRIEGIVKDGTNRIGDLEFRLCELEEGCDIGKLGDTPTLGGGKLPEGPATTLPPVGGGGVELAMNEQEDFDRARAALESGDASGAAEMLAAFVEAFPAGPLTVAAHSMHGDALSQLGDTGGAARSYLNAFSADPEGTDAPRALLRLGESLGALGQVDDACLMLGEVAVRFPGNAAVAQADAARAGLNCP